MRAFEENVSAFTHRMKFYPVTGASLDGRNASTWHNLNFFVTKHLVEEVRNVLVLPMRQAPVAFDNSDAAAQASKGLREFKAYIAASDDQEMPGNVIEVERFDVRKRMSLGEPGDILHRGTRTGADNDIHRVAPARSRPEGQPPWFLVQENVRIP